MNQYVSQELLDWRVKRIALQNQIRKCNEGIEALRYFRAKLDVDLKELEKVKPKR